jgi:hypothetical protein
LGLLVSTGVARALEVYDGSSIQTAINNAKVGERITVYPGTYYEKLDINGKNISLIAFDDSGKPNDGVGDIVLQPNFCPGHGNAIEIYDSSSTIEGFTINADYENSGCLGGIYARGIKSSEGNSTKINVINNDIRNYGKNGITVNGEFTKANILGNVIKGRGVLHSEDWAQNGIQLGWGASIENIFGNTITDHYWKGCSQPGRIECTPWAAAGILFYNTEIDPRQTALIKTGNNFANNQHNILKNLESEFYSEIASPLE